MRPSLSAFRKNGDYMNKAGFKLAASEYFREFGYKEH